jgi:SAM-dependent methyltransferase
MANLGRHYTDPRLVDLYDLENTGRDDTDFYLRLAADLGADRIVDLGCGTGALARDLAAAGREVVGVDPAAAMLEDARRQPGAERVRWVKGDSGVLASAVGAALGPAYADLAVMTGNVAQVFLADADWATTLRDVHAALRPGGRLAFESRNPAARAWEGWTPETTRARFDSPHGPVETWLEVDGVGDGRVRFAGHNRFLATGEHVVAPDELRFRSRDELVASLTAAGFVVEQVWGDWNRGPFVASRRGA